VTGGSLVAMQLHQAAPALTLLLPEMDTACGRACRAKPLKVVQNLCWDMWLPLLWYLGSDLLVDTLCWGKTRFCTPPQTLSPWGPCLPCAWRGSP